MPQAELRGVQGLARELDAVARAAPVYGIADQRVADMLEVHADLVRAAGLEAAFDERSAPETLEHLVGGTRRLAAVRDGHTGSRPDVAAYRRIDGAARWRVALHQRDVDPRHAALGELPHEVDLRLDRLRHLQEPARVLVVALHDTGARHAGERRRMREQRVEKRAVGL